MLVVVCIAGAGFFIYLLVSRTGSVPQLPIQLPQGSLFPLQIETPGLQLSSDGAPTIVAGTYDVTNLSYALSRLDLGTHKVVWNALGQKDYLRFDALVAGDTLVYAVIDTRLLALQLSDGKQAWEASLPDSLPGACQHCLVFQNGQVVALTTDGSLGAYNAQTGHQSWEKRLDNTGRELYPVGSGVALTYAVKKGAALGIFDAATGDEQTHLEPSCQAKGSLSDNLETGAKIVFDTANGPAKAYIFYGFFNACVQRWDLATSQMDWEQVDADQSLKVSDAPILQVNGIFYYATENQLRALDAATGTQAQTLDQSEEYTFVPLLVDGQRLVVRAKRTRGSTRYELWGYDLESGHNLWKRPLPNSEPIDPPNEMVGLIDKDTSGWTYAQTAAGVWLITFQTGPNQVNLAQVNLDTGELSNPKSISLGLNNSDTTDYDIPKRLEGPGHEAGFTLSNQLYFIDPTTDKFPYRWP